MPWPDNSSGVTLFPFAFEPAKLAGLAKSPLPA